MVTGLIILASILTLPPLILKIAFDYKEWLKKRDKVNTKSITAHGLEWLIMAVLCAPSIYLFTRASSLPWYYAALLSGAMIAFFIWLFFDGFYNVLRGFGWWFIGSEEKDDAHTDNFLQFIPLWLHITIKVGGLALLITLYILL